MELAELTREELESMTVLIGAEEVIVTAMLEELCSILYPSDV